jgi:RNA polymerase sigma factor (sigma-70 family)
MAGRQVSAAMLMQIPDATRSDPDSPQQEAMRLFAEHGAGLYRFCLFTLRHHQDAEDVVQDTFIKLLEHLEHHADRASIRSWLFTVAANACRDRFRRRLRWLPWSLDADRRVSADDQELAHAQDEQRAALYQAARTLKPRDRLLLMLRVQGLSYREIAAAADVPETSVGRLLARALSRWKQGYTALHTLHKG